MTVTPPHSQRKALCSVPRVSRARADPTPSSVAYSHRAMARRGSRAATRTAVAGSDGVGQGREVEPAAEVPDDAGLVVGIKQAVDGGGVEDHPAIRGPEAGRG